MSKFIKIQSNDHTDMLIPVDKILYVIEKENGCEIGLRDGIIITSSAEVKDVEKAIVG